MKLKFCLFIISIFIFQSCKKKADERFTRTWYDTEYVIPNDTRLKLNENFTFNYSSGGCGWDGFSKGTWEAYGDTIVLNSKKMDTCYNVFSFGECLDLDGFENRKIPTTIPNCSSETNTDFTIFKDIKFYLKKDSLIFLRNSNSNCPDSLKIIFANTKKTKKGS